MTHKERKRFIKTKGLSQYKIAKAINYNPSRISQVLKNPKDSCYRIQKVIADALGVDYERFWNDKPINKGS